MIKSPTTILFDLDGTLVDTRPGIQHSILFTVERVGKTFGVSVPTPSQAELNLMIGPPMPDTLRSLVGPDHVDAALGFYRERYESAGKEESEAYAGIADALGVLKARGHRLFVATSKLETSAHMILDHFALTSFFEKVYGSAADGARAHKPELLAYLLSKEGLDAKTCAMIGDRKFDMAGAISAGVEPVGALWGYGSREELVGAGAVRLIAAPNEIAATFTS